METISLGSQGLVVSRQGLGCMGMSEFYGAGDDDESIATIHRALELGVTFFDTADMYGPFTNEVLVGRALGRTPRARRSSPPSSATCATPTIRVGGPSTAGRSTCGRPAMRRCPRLGTDYIDLYYQHRVDPDTPIEETVGAMGELVQAGKVRYLGLSEAAPATIRRAHAVHPISALADRVLGLERATPRLRSCPQSASWGSASSPTARSGAASSPAPCARSTTWTRTTSAVTSRAFSVTTSTANIAIVEQIDALASAKGCTPAQVALAWVHAQGRDLAPIPGTKRRVYLEENIGALDVVLSDDDLARLDAFGTAPRRPLRRHVAAERIARPRKRGVRPRRPPPGRATISRRRGGSAPASARWLCTGRRRAAPVPDASKNHGSLSANHPVLCAWL